MPTAELTIAADLSGLRKQLESIPGITAEQAKAMTAELNKSFKSAEKAAASAARATTASMEKASEATRAAAASGKSLEDRFGNVGTSAGKLAGALDMLAPGLGSVGQGIADLADVGEVAAGSLGGVAAPALGALAVAAVALAPVLMNLQAEMAAEAEAARVMGTAHEYARSELELQRVATLDLAVATGTMTEAQRTEADIRAASADRLGTYLETLTETVTTTREAEVRNLAIADTIGNVIDTLNKLNPTMWLMKTIMGDSLPTATELTKKFTDYIGVTGKLEAAEKNAAAAHTVATEAAKKTRDAQLGAAAAKAKHTTATKDLSSALKKSAADKEADAAAAALQKEAADLNAEVERIMADEFNRTATEAEKLQLKLLSLQEATASLAAQGVDVDTSRAQEVLAKQVAVAEEAARVKAAEDAKKAQDAQLAADIEFYAKRAEIANTAADVVASYSQYKLDQQVTAYEDAVAAQEALGANATAAEKKRAAEEVAEKRKQAMIGFIIDKAAKLAQALTASALATVNALATPPAPNYLAAGLAAAGGAVQVASIAATRPSFHSGGMVDFAPDEASAIVRRGEAVLSPAGRRAIGDSAIRDANAGIGGSQTIIVAQVYRHRVFDSFVTDNLRTRGPLARALGSGARAGQRRS